MVQMITIIIKMVKNNEVRQKIVLNKKMILKFTRHDLMQKIVNRIKNGRKYGNVMNEDEFKK